MIWKSNQDTLPENLDQFISNMLSNYETFVLGDDRDPTDDEMEILKSFDKLKIGQTSLLTSACITLIHHFLDE